MNFLDLFAQKLREKREQKKITQRELAERLNMCTWKCQEMCSRETPKI